MIALVLYLLHNVVSSTFFQHMLHNGRVSYEHTFNLVAFGFKLLDVKKGVEYLNKDFF